MYLLCNPQILDAVHIFIIKPLYTLQMCYIYNLKFLNYICVYACIYECVYVCTYIRWQLPSGVIYLFINS